MASTYSTSLRIQLIGTGEQSGVWGSTTNSNLGTIIEQAITGVQTISLSGTSLTLTSLNGVVDQARNAVLIFTGTPAGTFTVTTPAVPKLYTIYNNTSGGYGIVITTGSGSTVTIPNGVTISVYCDGTNYYSASNYNSASVAITGGTINGTTIGATTASTGAFTTLSTTGLASLNSLNLTTALAATYGGTGVTTLTGLAYGNGTSAFTAATGSQIVSVIGSTFVTNATNATNILGTVGVANGGTG